MKLASEKTDRVKAFTFISLFFLLLGLSPVIRVISIFSFFDYDTYFIPRYIPYILSGISAFIAIYYLQGNKSKIYVAVMMNLNKTCIALSLFMVLYFFALQLLIYIGSSSIPEYCMFSNGMLCQSAWLSGSSDRMSLSLVNGFGKPMLITHVSCTKNRDQFEQCDQKRCQGYDVNKGGLVLQPGASAGFFLTCNDEKGKPLSFSKGELYDGKIVLWFYFTDEPPENKRKLVGSIGSRSD